MKRLMMVALVFMAVPAMADLLVPEPAPGGFAGHGVIDAVTKQVVWNGAAPRADVVYSNITNGPTAAYARAWPPASEMGDELLMTSGGILDAVGFSVYNSSSSAGELQTADLTLRFYNWDGGVNAFVPAGSLSLPGVDFGTGGLPAGYYTILAFTNVSQVTTINLTADVLATLTIDNLLGRATRVGQVLMNPPTIGSSTDDFFKDGSWYNFGGTPVANFYWQIGVVPEPAALGLLALGGLALLRRR
jgi:hypothetical protein